MQFDFTMAGYGSQNIETAGRFVKYVRGVGQIRVRFDKGGYIDLLPGQGCTGLDFSRLTIEDRSGVGNVGVLLAGAFMFQDDRISGDVSVIDGAKNRTIANNAFIGNGDVNGVGSQYPYSQLWNPAGSGKNLVLSGLTVSCAEMDTAFSFGSYGVAFPTLNLYGYSKKLGGDNSVAELRSTNNASVLQVAFPAAKQLQVITTKMNLPATVAFKEPIVIPPGMGLYVWNANASVSTRCSYEFIEDAI